MSSSDVVISVEKTSRSTITVHFKERWETYLWNKAVPDDIVERIIGTKENHLRKKMIELGAFGSGLPRPTS